MKTETKVKSIFDPLVQKDLLGKARVATSKGCVHLRDREADKEGMLSYLAVRSIWGLCFNGYLGHFNVLGTRFTFRFANNIQIRW